MTDKYILVKVREADAEFPPNVVVVNGKVVMPQSNLAKIRKAIHEKADEQFISVADFSTGRFVTEDERATLERVFNSVFERAKRGYRKHHNNKEGE